jgi:hypothetical protein
MPHWPNWPFTGDGTDPIFAETNFSESEELAPFYPDMITCHPACSMDTIASAGQVEPTIDPALLSRNHDSSAVSTNELPMQQP